MKKQKKQSFLEVVVKVFLLVMALLAVVLLLGVFSSLKPLKSVELGREQRMMNTQVYVPTGYQLTKKAERVEFDGDDIFVTQMEHGNDMIKLIQQNRLSSPCKGETLVVSGRDVCKVVTKDPSGAELTHYMWGADDVSYQLDFDATQVDGDEVAKIVESL